MKKNGLNIFRVVYILLRDKLRLTPIKFFAMNKEHETIFTECLLDFGQSLLESGAEISRVEDTLMRIGRAYGAKRIDVFVITSIISLTLEFSGSDIITETRRIYASAGTDFYKLEKLNALSREVCHEKKSVSDFRAAIDEISALQKNSALVLAGSILASGGFAVFFGGSVWDGLVSSIFACAICFMQHSLGKTQINPAASNLLISFVTGLAAGGLCKFVGSLHMDKILIGDIMLLIPGLALTNSVRNILVGNTISGVIRLIECFIWTWALAVGFMAAILLLEIL